MDHEERMARVGRNESSFRTLNEQLKKGLGDLRAQSRPETVGFVCECGDGDCAQLVQVSPQKYERSAPTRASS